MPECGITVKGVNALVCLDTDILVSLLRGHPTAKAKLEALICTGEELTTTPINVTELFKGAYRSSAMKKNLDSVSSLVQSLRLLDNTVESAKRAAELMVTLESQGKHIGDMDCIIAAIAMTHHETFITRNIKHFRRVTGLRVETW